MKTLALGLLTLIAVPCAPFAQPTPGAIAFEQPASGDFTETGMALNGRLTDAYRRGDWAALQALVAPDYSGITEDFEWDFASLKREFPKIRLIDSKVERQRVKLLSPDLILVNEVFTMSETFDGEDISGRYCSSNVWVRRNGRWLLLVEQEVRLHESGKVSASLQSSSPGSSPGLRFFSGMVREKE
jgi:Domain of unknown function (DUF4440)